MNNRNRLLSIFLLFFACSANGFTEKISSFISDITVHTDGHLTVHEKITVNLETGRRGLFRDFPITYTTSGNLKSCVDFVLEKVLANGQPVQHSLENLDNGIRVKIGDPYKLLQRGSYTYDIFYTTGRQLGFFETHDELYWNVTGNGWRMPIEVVQATIHLPNGAHIKSVEAYTGYYGNKDSNYTAQITHNNVAVWKTAKPLAQGQGITIVATWQKGIITPPTHIQKLYHFIYDNIAFILLWLGLLLSLGYAWYVWMGLAGHKKKGTIIPLFNPPGKLTPAQMRYLMEYKYDHKVLATQLIDMAVKGHITIESKKGFLTSYYEIKRVENASKEAVNAYQTTLECLFKKSNTLALNKGENEQVLIASTALQNSLLIAMAQYFDHQDHHIVVMIFFGIATVALYFMLGGIIYHHLLWIAALWFGIAFAFVWRVIKCYTARGKKLRDEVEGFKLFLATTEQERLKFVSTPPTRTPELYESYLPYAVALGVEEQWTAQFAPVFAQLKKQGTPYTNHWYIHDLHRYTAHSVPAHIGSTLTHCISTSVPGSSSGSQSGSSGGGGGGGGGGAW